MRTQLARRAPPSITHTGRVPLPRSVKPVARFAGELGGMCAVMCIGGMILSFASFAVAG
jgi:hypothetical protein